MNEIVSYITALRNCMDRQSAMVSTTEVVEHLDDLLSFVMDIPDDRVIEVVYEDGSDGMDEWYRKIMN